MALSPSDPVLHHMLGVWCFEVARLDWVTRSVASALFGAPPVSSYAEALGHLARADELGTARGTPLMTTRLTAARCHAALRDSAAASAWLRRAAELPPGPGEDEDAMEQLQRLAASLSVRL